MQVMTETTVMFAVVDLLLGVTILSHLWTNWLTGEGLFPLINRVRLEFQSNVSGRHFRIASASTSVASAGQLVLNFAYLFYLASGGAGLLPLQFPNTVEFGVVATATAIREFAGAYSRYHYVKGLKRVYRWMLKEEKHL